MSFSSQASFRTISAGFLAVILTGAILLWLPFASHQDGYADFLDCLFTATSATCVTGLVVHDTASHWTLFGQIVILILIQLGGMGVLTVALAITKLSGQQIDLRTRSSMQNSVSAPTMGGIVRLAAFIIKGTLLFEAVGTLLLAFSFCPIFGFWKGLWYAFFHSISAFCNAGFDLMGTYSGHYSSLTSFITDPLVNLTVCPLIVIGGLGFLTWEDIYKNKLQWKRYSMQSKSIILLTAALIVLPFVFFYFFEHVNLTQAERFWSSLFQTVTVRTAGYNTVDFNLYSENGIFLFIVLMIIGGAPGSTAGGIKITTLTVLTVTAVSVYRRKDVPQCFGRRIPDETVRDALAILSLYLFLFAGSAMVISIAEGLPLITCLFETASAIATVGVTMGITAKIGWLSKAILIFLMFFGRVGGLTLIYAAVRYNPAEQARCPKGSITVG